MASRSAGARRSLPGHHGGRGGQHEDQGAEQRRPCAAGALGIKQTTYTFHQTTSSCGHGGAAGTIVFLPTILFQGYERRGVGGRVSAHCDHHIVTTVFAFGANHARDPPDRGVIEQETFDASLHDIREIIPAADVRQFMQQNRFDLFHWQPGQQTDGHQNQWTEMAENHGHFRHAGLQQQDWTRYAQLGAQAAEFGLPALRRTAHSATAQAANRYPAGQLPQAEHPHAHDPE